jgi:hypothetical protein
MRIKVEGKTVEVKRIYISAKCSDLCYAELIGPQSEVVAEHDGYVPALMPEEHFGDYVELQIDLETGKIMNWKKPSRKVIEETKWTLPK